KDLPGRRNVLSFILVAPRMPAKAMLSSEFVRVRLQNLSWRDVLSCDVPVQILPLEPHPEKSHARIGARNSNRTDTTKIHACWRNSTVQPESYPAPGSGEQSRAGRHTF